MRLSWGRKKPPLPALPPKRYNPKDRRGLGCSPDSLKSLGKSRDWLYLLDALDDQLKAAEVSLVNCDANDAGKVGRIQATVNLLTEFLDGRIIDGLVEEAKETELARKRD